MSYSRLSLSPQFYAGIYTPHGIVMNRYYVDIQMITMTNSSFDHNIAVERIRYIANDEFDSSILINEKEAEAKELLEAAGFNCHANLTGQLGVSHVYTGIIFFIQFGNFFNQFCFS